MANPFLARIVRLGGGKLLDRAVGKFLPAQVPSKTKSTLGKGLASGALVSLATRSVPGAIVIGGGLLAKTLYDRRRAVREQNSGAVSANEADSDAIG